MKKKVAINGFGRIGRAYFNLAKKSEEIEVVAINDLGSLENLTYLLKYDSVFKKSESEREKISYEKENNNFLIYGGKKINFFQEADPAKLPWKELEIDVVIESTGFFKTEAGAKKHLEAGAKKVVISAPSKENENENISSVQTVLMGVNDEKIKNLNISSNGSCTTNATALPLKILDEKIGVEKAFLNTIHSYTSSQKIVDSAHSKDFRRGRAGAFNIVPTSTGAAKSVASANENFSGKFDGISIRVPTIAGSIADLTFVSKKETSSEEINKIFEEASLDDKYREIISVSNEALVSSDIVGSEYAAILDKSFTKVVGGNLVKVLFWYDNETGYSKTLLLHSEKIAKEI